MFTPHTQLAGLYLVTPDWDNTHQLLTVSELALKGGASILQYRHKTANSDLRYEQAQALQALCQAYQCPFIINDHVDLCLKLDADGVHVGKEDKKIDEVRKSLGPKKIVGTSCYGELTSAKEAAKQGASYIAFGGFYPSRIKQYAVTTPLAIIESAQKAIDLPIVVIGGMTQTNCTPFIQKGVDMVAAISSIYFADNPQQAAHDFTKLFMKKTYSHFK